MNELMQSPVLSGEDARALTPRLVELLAWQARKYTKGESSSVTIETAQELLASLRYTISLVTVEMGMPYKQLLTDELPPLIRKGQAILQARLEQTKQLYAAVCQTAPELQNGYYADTLRGIGDYFKRYDLYFFAHLKPPCIDYPLLIAADESLQGPDFTEQYLKRVLTENLLLRRFDSREVRELLSAIDGDIEEAYLNLCEQPLINAIGLTLLGHDTRQLHIRAAEREEIAALLQSKTPEQRRRLFRGAVLNLCGALHVTGERSRWYLTMFADNLLPRLDAALDAGDVSGVFIE